MVITVAAEQPVVLIESMVNSAVEGPNVTGNRRLEQVVRRSSPAAGRALDSHELRHVGIGEQGKQIGGNRIDTWLTGGAGRLDNLSNHATGLSGDGRVANRLWKFREIPFLHQRCWNDTLNGGGLPAAETLKVAEEECLVTDNRAAKRAAELILNEMALLPAVLIVNPRVCVESVVAHVFKNVAMIGIRAGLKGCVNHGSGRIAKFGRIRARLDAKFLHRIGRRLNDLHRKLLKIFRPGVVVDAVQEEIVLQFEISVDAEAVRGRIGGQIELLDTRFEEGEVRVAAAVERKIVYLLSVHDIADIRVLCLKQRFAGGHNDLLVDGADLENKFDGKPVLDVKNQAIAKNAVKSFGADLDRVSARNEGEHLILTRVIDRRRQNHASVLVCDGNRGLRHSSAGRIQDPSDDGSAINLRKRR